MKREFMSVVVFVFSIAAADIASGSVVDGFFWAEEVTAWTGDIQNYGHELMTWDTTWWLTGAPDADADGNGYAWDAGDNDFVAGWRAGGGASITVFFETAISDLQGSDLLIHSYAGPGAAATIWASVDDVDYVLVGELGGGTAGYFSDDWIDFAGLVDSAHYIRLVRDAVGPQTGVFIDALGTPSSMLTPTPINGLEGKWGIGGDGLVPLPEPGTIALLGLGILAFTRQRR